MKKNLTRNLLAVLTLAVLLGMGVHVRAVRAQAAAASQQKPAATASAPEAQTPEKNNPQEQNENDEYRMSPHVVEWGAKLGLNPEQAATAFTVTNFVLLALGVAWLVVKFLPKTIRDRNSAIQKSLLDARTATEEARERLSGVEERLGKLDGEIAAMRALAEQDSARAEQRIKATVEDGKVRILAAAEQEIASATSHAQKQLQQYAAALAIEQAARKLVVTAETDRLLVQGFAQRLTGDDSKKGQN
ncbi:MAG: ATP synthase F0 subunit B [Acidobacteriaceae bacterium]